MRLGFITSNKGKLLELQTALEPMGHEVIQLMIDYPELQADTIIEVAKFGLEWIVEHSEVFETEIMGYADLDLIFLEDSGLFINALNDFPGVYSKFIFKTIGINGVLELMGARKNREAYFESCIAACEPKSNKDHTTPLPTQHRFKGVCRGSIAAEPRGAKGFGFDPIFRPEGEKKTFAEMEPNEKNKYSHRGKAIEKFVKYLMNK